MCVLAANFISEMQGPDFLLFYSFVSALTILAGYILNRSLDTSMERGAPQIPKDPDPYEIAYLRGGENEVIRVVAFNLVQRGYWIFDTKSGSFSRAAKADGLQYLTSIERKVYSMVNEKKDPSNLFSYAAPVKLFCANYDEKMIQEGYSYSEQERVRMKWVSRMVMLFLSTLALYKIVVAVNKGRTNIGFLITLSLIALLISGFVLKTPRQTIRGKSLLASLKTAFTSLKRTATRLRGSAEDLSAPLVLAIFGVGAFAGTSYGWFHDSFKRSSHSSSCGSGCGSSCSSGGGGCGGGCGGCGGCGG